VGPFLGIRLSRSRICHGPSRPPRKPNLPDQLTIFVGTHTIGEGTPATEMLAADRNGIDHIINWFPVIARIFIDALSQ
jgi:hypothetical protein